LPQAPSGDRTGEARRAGYIVRSWPRLSQTFIVQEIRALERLGVDIEIFSLSRSGEVLVQPEVAEIKASVTFLDEAADVSSPRRSMWWLAAARAHPRALVHTWRSRDWDRGYHVATRWECLRLAMTLASIIAERQRAGRALRHLHAHFIHDSATVAHLTGKMTGMAWSVTAHARDLYQVAPRVIAERVRSAAAVITICESNLEYLRSLVVASDRPKLHLIHNGIDLADFPLRSMQPDDHPLRIVSIARLVEKKGVDDLIEACRRLAADGVPFKCQVFGDGPLADELRLAIDRLGLHDSVTLEGSRTRRELIGVMADSDAFALLPYVTSDGDRDGIPTVLVEAMACGLPVVSTDVAGIPDLVVDGVNGFLLDRRDVVGAAHALARLAREPDLGIRLGKEGRRTVEAEFDGDRSAEQLLQVFSSGARHG
jgi:glycosyltransferase involved in cell wall biosynthesis